MRNGFTFGDKSTWDFAMRVERLPEISGPEKNVETIVIPGRNGALHQYDGSYSNYPQEYECYFHGSRPTAEMTHAIRAWLSRKNGYQKLVDVMDPDHYRLAAFAGPLDVANILNKYGRCTVTFDCAPQSFLAMGDEPVIFDVEGSLANPTGYPAQPIIKVYSDAPGTLEIGGTPVEILDIHAPITLDCEMLNAIGFDGSNQNANIYAPSFPVLGEGETTIRFSGGITRIEIKPRWWEL